MSKITFTSVQRARDCVDWAKEHIGPAMHNPGSSIRGEGWHCWTNIHITDSRFNKPTYTMELNEHVDVDTKLLFMLKWS